MLPQWVRTTPGVSLAGDDAIVLQRSEFCLQFVSVGIGHCFWRLDAERLCIVGEGNVKRFTLHWSDLPTEHGWEFLDEVLGRDEVWLW